MEITYLRALRLRYEIALPRIAERMGVSPQRLSQLELRQTSCTREQERAVSAAVEAWIADEKKRLEAIERSYLSYKGRLLSYMGEQNDGI